MIAKLREGLAHRFGPLLAQRRFGLHPQHGEGGAELVRGVGDEPSLKGDRVTDPSHQLVDSIDQRGQLVGSVMAMKWSKVRGRAPRYFGADPAKRSQASPDAQPDHPRSSEKQHERSEER